MVKPTSKTPVAEKPARSKTRAAATTPKAVRKTTKVVTAVKTAKIDPVASEPAPKELTKKELVERLVKDTDMKKGDARRALEAVLSVLGDALAEGANLSAAPLGKVKITRSKETDNGQLVVCRIKLKKPQSASDEG